MMISIEPAIEKKFGRASLKKQEVKEFLAHAIQAAELTGAVSVLLTGDEEIRRLNREFRQKDKATDVLSFPAAQLPATRPSRRTRLAGDLAISVETAAREATAREHALELELKILLLHGVLHLAGWDHETDSGEMAQKEKALRKQLGLDHGLIERASMKSKRSKKAAKREVPPSLSGTRRGRTS
jgi:probable rRNA maturation factor